MIKKMFVLLIAVLFVVPFVVAADDFDDDFGGDEEDSEEAEEEEEEEAPAKKKSKEMSESDAAMKDLMGDPEEDKPAKSKKERKNSDEADVEDETAPAEKSASDGKLPKGLKPVLLVKGGFTVMGQYKIDNTKKKYDSMFGSLDEGIVGIEYQGAHVLAKGTLNIRTNYFFIENGTNPLAKVNYHSIQNGAANALYEFYGGVKFYDVFIKAGKIIPEYGLVDTWQNLGMGFTTPFLTRSLVVVEGYLPETDAGFALGYNGIIKKDHNVFVGLSLGTGSNSSEFWHTDKTLGLYLRVGYGFKNYVKAAFALQHRKDFYLKKLDMTGIGVHLNVSAKGFEMPITFDYNMRKMARTDNSNVLTKDTASILLSVAPGYAYHFNHEWIDKVGLALRYDFVMGIYTPNNQEEVSYLDYTYFKNKKNYMRIGVTANFFTKELAGVRGMAGLTFLMQPDSKITTSEKVYGFTTVVLQAGAEF